MHLIEVDASCREAEFCSCGSEEREGLMADQMRHGLAQRVRGLLEQERWIGTGFYAHVRVTRVNDGTVRLRVRPHARPGRFVTVWISWSCLPGEGAGCG